MNSNSLVLSTGSTLAMPEGLAIVDRANKAGRSLGVRLSFTGEKSATVLKAEGVKNGLKGKALRTFVDAGLKGDAATGAWVRHDAVVSAMRSAGFVPVEADTNKKGDQFKVTFRRPEGEAARVEIEQAKLEEREALKTELLAAGVPAELLDAAIAKMGK